MGVKVTVIGHIVPAPTSLPVGDSSQLGSLLKLYNYTRVLTSDRRLVDHVAYLKETSGIPTTDTFSVWEMYLCASILLQSHLERNGVEVQMLNYIDSENEDAEFRSMQNFNPDIVVISTTFFLTSKHLKDAGKMIRKYLPNTFIVAGGHHVFTTLMYLDDAQKGNYLQAAKLDAFVNDVQGEKTLLDLVKAFPDRLEQVPNLVWRNKAGESQINARTVEKNDIHDTLLDFGQIKPGSVIHMRTARSCAFKCAFCSYPTIAGDLALMELNHAMDTMKKAKDAGVSSIFFVDDTFNVPKERFEKFVDMMIEENLGMPWYSFLRCQFVDEKLVERMKRSGCQGVFLGVESGSDQILKNMNKGCTSTFYRRGIKWLKEQGIITVGAFVVGFPGETRDTVAQTSEFIQNSGLDFYFLQPFYYLHHTPIHKFADKYGLTGNGLVWSHNTMNADEACSLLDNMFLSIKGPTFANPDYTLWEVAYLMNKGFDLPRVRKYRDMINDMTVSQMKNHGSQAGSVTSRAGVEI